MTDTQALEVMHAGIVVSIKLAAPILILSMLVGLLISIFQAATQIHEQTITFVPKLVLIAIVLLLGGSWMMETLKDFTMEIFRMMLQ